METLEINQDLPIDQDNLSDSTSALEYEVARFQARQPAALGSRALQFLNMTTGPSASRQNLQPYFARR